jgi:hypothetical protein
MKNIINEELNQMKYLFGYKRGVVISEQNLQKSLEFANKFAKDVTLQKVEKLKSLQGKADDDIKAGYDPYIKYYTDLSQGIQATPPNKEFTDKFDASFSLNSNKPTTDKTKLNLPQLKSDVEKYEDSIMTNAPDKIKDALNQNRDSRSVGVADSMDGNTAKKNAFNQAKANLAKKLQKQNQNFSTPINISGVKDDKTYVVLGIA